MKTCIYVFSGTGTSLAAAQRIAEYLGDTTVMLISNALRTAQSVSADAPVVGLIFPNYFGGLPRIVLEFIQKTDFSGAHYIFSVVTGGAGYGRCFGQLRKVLKSKGRQLDYGNGIVGLSNYMVGWYYRFVVKTGARLDIAVQKLNKKAQKIAADVAEKKREVDKDQPFSYFVSRLLSPKKIIEDTRQWDRHFGIDSRCAGCGTCEKVCQVRNISMVKKTPVFGHNCQRCMACIQYCPAGAILYKQKPLVAPRYTHPDFPATIMIKRIHGETP